MPFKYPDLTVTEELKLIVSPIIIFRIKQF